MSDEKKVAKKRTRIAGGVRVTIPFSDEERLAIGKGTKATNDQCAEWARDHITADKPGLLRAYYEERIRALGQ